MSRVSPTLEGIRAAFRRRSLTFAEIAWRWTLGATAAALFVFYCIEYLDTLPVSNSDALLLSTRQPALVGQAITHILRGSLDRAVMAASLAALALSVLWIIASSLGRLATVRALLEYFREEVIPASFHASVPDVVPDVLDGTGSALEERRARARPMRTLIDLNFLRVTLALALVLSLVGAAILSSAASAKASPRPDLAVLMFLLLAAAICLTAWLLNWWLSLAAIFAVRDGEDAMGSLSAAVTFFRGRFGAVCAVGAWTGLAHLVAFSVATTAVSFPLAFLRIVPSRLVIAGMILIALVYFALADWLFMARLAGLICITEMPDPSLAPLPLSAAPPRGDGNVEGATIDRTESILSDAPAMAMKT